MRKRVKCFEDVFDSSRAHMVFDGGLRVIEVSKIKGSVDKCGELDDRFRYIKRRDRRERSRRYQLEEAQRRNAFLPPVEVYLYEGEYFVVDGHRRVASALNLGIEFMDAHVREYVYQGDALGMAGALSRKRFESETGIKSIALTYEYGYRVLLEDISRYFEGAVSEQKARNWYNNIYLPAVYHIKGSMLPEIYRGLQTGDIYVLIIDFFNKFMGGIPVNISFETIISGFSFAHHVQRKNIFRRLSSSIMQLLFFKKGGF
ncbi:MAG: hypothetical protein ACUVWJ_07685 [Spirochaetota bacterium]